jgi:hypothetical protein
MPDLSMPYGHYKKTPKNWGFQPVGFVVELDQSIAIIS